MSGWCLLICWLVYLVYLVLRALCCLAVAGGDLTVLIGLGFTGRL